MNFMKNLKIYHWIIIVFGCSFLISMFTHSGKDSKNFSVESVTTHTDTTVLDMVKTLKLNEDSLISPKFTLIRSLIRKENYDYNEMLNLLDDSKNNLQLSINVLKNIRLNTDSYSKSQKDTIEAFIIKYNKYLEGAIRVLDATREYHIENNLKYVKYGVYLSEIGSSIRLELLIKLKKQFKH